MVTDPGLDTIQHPQAHPSLSQYFRDRPGTAALAHGAAAAGARALAFDPGKAPLNIDDLSGFFNHRERYEARPSEWAIILTVAGGTSPTTITW